MSRSDIQSLFVRVCQDSGFQFDAFRAAQFAAKVGGFHPMDVWIAMPSLDVMHEIAAGKHPASKRLASGADCD